MLLRLSKDIQLNKGKVSQEEANLFRKYKGIQGCDIYVCTAEILGKEIKSKERGSKDLLGL